MCKNARKDSKHLFKPGPALSLFTADHNDYSALSSPPDHNCTEQNPSWEADKRSTGQETSCFLWNMKFRYRATGPYPEPTESTPSLTN
jgi:hypothetical protein